MLYRTRPQGPRPRFLLHIELLEGRIAPASLIAISDASVAEGDSGAVMMDFTVSRSGDLTAPVTVGYTTADGTAQAGIDYTAETGTVTIPAGAAGATVAIPVIGNQVLQPDRTFSVELTGVGGGSSAFGFGAPQQFSTGSGPFSVAAADFNGDGKPDLAVANSNSSTVSVLRNDTASGAATPSFAPGQDFATAASPESVTVGDFNRRQQARPGHRRAGLEHRLGAPEHHGARFDPPSLRPRAGLRHRGRPRVRRGGRLQRRRQARPGRRQPVSNSVSVLLNTTAPGSTVPSFAAQQDFATGSLPISVAVGDFNGDGKPDLAVADVRLEPRLGAAEHDGTGSAIASFSPRQDFVTGSAPDAVAVADLNGDGKPDLAVANFFSNTVSVLLNTTAPGCDRAQLRRQAGLRHRVAPRVRGHGGRERRRQARPGRRQQQLQHRVGAAEHDGAGCRGPELRRQAGLRHRLGARLRGARRPQRRRQARPGRRQLPARTPSRSCSTPWGRT